LADEFKLIEDNNQSYNVFIPYNGQAKKTWKRYLESFEIDNRFERKKYIKKLKPLLLQFVTHFPKEQYTPNDKDRSIIYDSDWKKYYNLQTGFIRDAEETNSTINH
ncbi:MAG: hypothetical protein AAF734_02340, partial [Bacteroidota bacterium]